MFRPVVPLSGLAGWQFLERTYDAQRKNFDKSPELARDTDYFAAKIGTITSAEALVSDRRLLRVTLGAFGLQDDLNSRALIRKVLEDGTTRTDALANRLSDSRYRALSRAFGFGEPDGPKTTDRGFADTIIAAFRGRSFEVAIGAQNNGYRLALNARRDLTEIVTSTQSDDTKWFRIMGSPPLRQVMEAALGLPRSFGQLDIERQLEVFKDHSSRQLGLASVSDLRTPEAMDQLVQRFLLRSDSAGGATATATRFSTALALLQR